MTRSRACQGLAPKLSNIDENTLIWTTRWRGGRTYHSDKGLTLFQHKKNQRRRKFGGIATKLAFLRYFWVLDSRYDVKLARWFPRPVYYLEVVSSSPRGAGIMRQGSQSFPSPSTVLGWGFFRHTASRNGAAAMGAFASRACAPPVPLKCMPDKKKTRSACAKFLQQKKINQSSGITVIVVTGNRNSG